MLRRLLTCLALLTGLAAGGLPVRAAQVEAVASALDGGATQSPVAEGGSVAIARIDRPLASAFRFEVSGTPVAAVPSVRIGSDRARE